MTIEEFQTKYHSYQVEIIEEARKEAEKVNEQADGFKVLAVEFPNMGCCLMVDTAVDAIKEMGII